MWFSNLPLKFKVGITAFFIFIPTMIGGTLFFSSQVEKYVAKTAAGGLMNFVDAKQHGTIRFLGQNEKLAKQLAVLVKSAGAGTDGENIARSFFKAVVDIDTFDPRQHPFYNEIASGKRQIPTTKVYRNIDYVRDEKIIISSDPRREGRSWTSKVDLKHGYSDVYEDGGKPTITFGAPVRGNRGMVYVNADALMLTNIVNGEIGNLEGDMGAFYLAGVGKSFDYYMVNRDNLMITESRVYRNAILRRPGSEAPWKYTLQTIGVDCDSSGTYVTNVGAVTGCREAMGYYTGTNGSKMLGASMPYYDSEWTIVVEQTADELLAPLNSLLNHMFVISVVAGLIGFTLFIFLINFYIFRRLPKVLQK